jgi:hypothetical protein
VLKNQVKPLLFIALHVITFPPLAKYSPVLTLPYDVAQLRKTWRCISMMVPTLKLYPSSVEVLVVSIVNGASVDTDLPSVFVMLSFQTYESMM